MEDVLSEEGLQNNIGLLKDSKIIYKSFKYIYVKTHTSIALQQLCLHKQYAVILRILFQPAELMAKEDACWCIKSME